MISVVVTLYLTMEGGDFLLPTFDACQLPFPFSREGGISDAHFLYHGIEGQPFLGRHKRLLAALHVAAGKESLDDGGTGGGSTDAALLHGLTDLLILHVLTCCLHSRQQGSLSMQGLGFGLALCEAYAAYGKGFSAFPSGQYLLLAVLAQYGTPPRLTYHAALGGKLRLTAEGGNGGEFLDAFVGEGLHHAPGNHLIHGVVLLG